MLSEIARKQTSHETTCAEAPRKLRGSSLEDLFFSAEGNVEENQIARKVRGSSAEGHFSARKLNAQENLIPRKLRGSSAEAPRKHFSKFAAGQESGRESKIDSGLGHTK